MVWLRFRLHWVLSQGSIHQRHRTRRNRKATGHRPAVHRFVDLPGDLIANHLAAFLSHAMRCSIYHHFLQQSMWEVLGRKVLGRSFEKFLQGELLKVIESALYGHHQRISWFFERVQHHWKGGLTQVDMNLALRGSDLRLDIKRLPRCKWGTPTCNGANHESVQCSMDIHGSSKSTFISDQVYPYIRYCISVHLLLNSSMWLIRFKESQHFLVRSDHMRIMRPLLIHHLESTWHKSHAGLETHPGSGLERLGWSHLRANCKLQIWNSFVLRISWNFLLCNLPRLIFSTQGRPAWPRQTNEHRSHFGQEFEPASEETFQTRFAV